MANAGWHFNGVWKVFTFKPERHVYQADEHRDFASDHFFNVLSKQKLIRRRPKKRAIAGHAQKRSPASGRMRIHFKEAFNAEVECQMLF
jgi:hypothetical protein